MGFGKNVVSRLTALALRLYSVVIRQPLMNAAPYGFNKGCNEAEDALSKWIQNGSAKQTCIEYDNLKRCWFTFIPDSVNTASKVPLVVHLHGAGGCASLPAMGWGSLAEENGFAVVWPQGTSHQIPFVPDWFPDNILQLNCWNDGSQLFGAEKAGIDDMGFLKTMLQQVLSEEDTVIDRKRVYMSGHSNGAVMAQRFAVQTEGVLAGVLAVGGLVFPNDSCKAEGDRECWKEGQTIPEYNPTPIMIVAGKIDEVSPYDKRRNALSGALPSVEGWAQTNNCSTSVEVKHDKEGHARIVYSGCDNGATVALLSVEDAGHHVFTKGRGQFQISPVNVIARCEFRYLPPPPYEPDCQLSDLDTTSMAWDYLSQFQLPTPSPPEAQHEDKEHEVNQQ